MLATMRPGSTSTAAHSPSASHHQHSNHTSRPPSRAASVTSSNNSSSNLAAAASPVKLSTSGKSKRNAARSNLASKAQQHKASQQPQPIPSSSNTPGLISLSRPVEVSSPRRSNKKPTAKAIADAEALNGTDEALLSRSAPLPAASNSRRQKKKADAAVAQAQQQQQQQQQQQHFTQPSAQQDSETSALTWQQQLLGIGSQKPKHVAASSTLNSAPIAAGGSAKPLTWQQELFGSSNKAKRGPHFDVFADARDAETFGGGSGGEDNGVQYSSGRARAGSVGRAPSRKGGKGNNKNAVAIGADLSLDDVFGGKAPSKRQNPSTPMKTGNRKTAAGASPAHQHLAIPGTSNHDTADGIAYAGPDFHNSPSAASLPAPKFMSKKHNPSSSSASSSMMRSSSLKQGNSSGDETSDKSASEDEKLDREKRSSRGVTAPPAIQHQQHSSANANVNANGGNKSVTIENLLAQMMGGNGGGLSLK